jgi:hypothetical protein
MEKEQKMTTDQSLRTHVVNQLTARQAHLTFDDAVANFPLDRINERPPHVSYTPWHLLEHIRIAQEDILDFVQNPDYTELSWPDEYWPAPDAEADAAQWQATLDAYRSDLAALVAIVEDEAIDLLAEIPHAPGYTYLREALLVADHTAYHVGEFAILRQIMGTWPDDRDESDL